MGTTRQIKVGAESSKLEQNEFKHEFEVEDAAGDIISLILDSGTGGTVTDEINSKGLEYAADYSANFTDNSLASKKYVDDNAGGSSVLNFQFGSDNKSYLKGKDATYEMLSQFFFEGTTAFGTPTTAKIRFTNKGGITSSVRIYDVTNAQVIAEQTGLDPAVEEVFETVNMGALSNLPAAEAIFEVQLRVSADGGGKETWVASLFIK